MAAGLRKIYMLPVQRQTLLEPEKHSPEKSIRILIVDDNDAVRRGIRMLLESSQKFAICGEARDGIDAIKKASEFRPDAIIMDVTMPRLDGLQATRAIRQSHPETKVIIVSQNDPAVVGQQAAEVGADGYVAKSDLAQHLISTIEGNFSISDRTPVVSSAPVHRGMPFEAENANALLAAIVASSDDAIVSKNLDGTITSWNKSAERLFGYTAEEAVGKHITLIIPRERWNEEDSIIARLRRGERVDHFETIRRRKDGSTIELSLTISPVRDSTGRIIGASKVARDITQQKRAERALRESEERFRAIVETTPECVTLVARDGSLLQMNSSGLRMIGASCLEAVAGKSIYERIAPEDRDRFRIFNERVCAGEKSTLEFDIVTLDGQRRHMETHAAPLRISEGPVVQLAVMRDVTEQKCARERERRITAEVLAANAKFRAVFEQTTVFAGIMTKDGILIEANKLSLDACGFRAEDALGLPFWKTPWWRNFSESQEKIREATPRVAQGIPYREMLRYSSADGAERLVDFALYPIVDEYGTVLFLHPTGVDVTDIKSVGENYRKLSESLESEVLARTRELEERNADVLKQSEQLRDLSRQLVRAQDEERRHIARELHDSAGQTLAVLGVSVSQLANKMSHRAPGLAADASAIQELVRQLQREVRTTSYLLHPPLLDENGLYPALKWYVQGLVDRGVLDIHLEIAEAFGRLPGDMELLVFRLVQECLTNIHRHSGSGVACIRIRRDDNTVTAEIRDEGKGMSAEKLAGIQSGKSGVGIRGMRERLRHFHGQMTMESDCTGTKIVASIPLPHAVAGSDRKEEFLQAAP